MTMGRDQSKDFASAGVVLLESAPVRADSNDLRRPDRWLVCPILLTPAQNLDKSHTPGEISAPPDAIRVIGIDLYSSGV